MHFRIPNPFTASAHMSYQCVFAAVEYLQALMQLLKRNVRSIADHTSLVLLLMLNYKFGMFSFSALPAAKKLSQLYLTLMSSSLYQLFFVCWWLSWLMVWWIVLWSVRKWLIRARWRPQILSFIQSHWLNCSDLNVLCFNMVWPSLWPHLILSCSSLPPFRWEIWTPRGNRVHAQRGRPCVWERDRGGRGGAAKAADRPDQTSRRPPKDLQLRTPLLCAMMAWPSQPPFWTCDTPALSLSVSLSLSLLPVSVLMESVDAPHFSSTLSKKKTPTSICWETA